MKDRMVLLPMKYPTVPLFRICESITDCHHSTPKWTDEGWLVIRNFNIKGGRLLLDKPSYTDEENYYQRISRAVPESGDIVITREAPMGEVCMVPEGLTCCLGQRMVLIKPNKNKIDPKYLLYVLQSEFLQKQIGSSDKTGSIVSNLRIPLLKELQIPRLGDTQEKAIGNLLYEIDSKIELNNRINAELEAMAKTIYDYWFVQFDFPISKELATQMGKPELEGRPYKSSGGKMVYNKELKRDVPEGWEVKRFDYFKMYQPKTISEKEMNPNGKYNVFGANGIIGRFDKFNHPESEIVVTCRGNSCGNIIRTLPYSWITGNAMIIRDESSALGSEFIYQMLRWSGLNSIISGSGQPQITRTNLETLNFILPSKTVLKNYNSLSDLLVKRKHATNYENQELASLRDWLLPMLMNGQVKVGEAKEYVQENKPDRERVGMAAERQSKYEVKG